MKKEKFDALVEEFLDEAEITLGIDKNDPGKRTYAKGYIRGKIHERERIFLNVIVVVCVIAFFVVMCLGSIYYGVL